MANARKIGFYWSDKFFYLTEFSEKQFNRMVVIPLPSSQDGPVDDIRLTALIQKTLRDEKIGTADVKLSIPFSEAIIRSFVIPMMKPAEADTVVEFEAKKYVPFHLKDLTYKYLTIPFTDNNVRKLRVVFSAVRKNVYERYCRVLEQAGLNVAFVESQPYSLVRFLVYKKIVPVDGKLAVMFTDGESIQIAFVYEGVVVFLREFQLNLPANTVEGVDEGALKLRFLNEVHNCLDFYVRQFSLPSISQLIFLENEFPYPLAQWLQEDGGFPLKVVEAKPLAGTLTSGSPIGSINTNGVSIVKDTSKDAINLVPKAVSRMATAMPSFAIDLTEYMGAIKVAAVCAAVLIGSHFLTQYGLTGSQKTIEDMKLQQGKYADLTQVEIQEKIDKAQIRIGALEKVKFKNKVLPILVKVAMNMPEGVWLNSFDFKYIPPDLGDGFTAVPADAKESYELILTGSAYNKEPLAQIRMVNDFIALLKKDKTLSAYFPRIRLLNMQRQDEKTEGSPVMFLIKCT